MPDLINQILLEQYRIDAFVASGGMGAVYRVWDLRRNVPLAMKVLHAELAEDPAMFKRFRREARALQGLAHPNIVPFYGLFQTPDFAFLLERYIDGPPLKDILRRQQGQPLPIAEVLSYAKALGAALGYAHANGVVHCDVKPGNVMVDRGGQIYLTDFGIARHAESTTTTMGTAGTPAYMTPEQILGAMVTPATDVYALGVMLFEMLTGQRPFRGTDADTEGSGATVGERIRYAHLKLNPPDPRTINPALSNELAAVILKALAKQPEQRWQTMQEFFAALCTASDVPTERVVEQVNLPIEFKTSAAPRQLSPQTVSAQPSSQVTRKRGIGLVVWGVVSVAVLTVAIMLMSKQGSFILPLSTPGNISWIQDGSTSNVSLSSITPSPPTWTGTPVSPAIPDQPTSDPALIYTAAAQTLQVQLTQTAQAVSPSPQPTDPPPSATPKPVVSQDDSPLGRSAGGRTIPMLRIGYVGEIAIVVVGSIDGTQTDTRDVINNLIRDYSSDSAQIPYGTSFYLIPSINPDGNANNYRFNDNNVDLNRNWDTENWTANPPVPGYTQGKEGAGGPYPFSEPETEALRSLMLGINKIYQKVILVILHSTVNRTQGEVFSGYNSVGFDSESKRLVNLMVSFLDYTYSTEWGDYDTPGEAIYWSVVNGMPALDIVWPKNSPPPLQNLMDAFSSFVK